MLRRRNWEPVDIRLIEDAGERVKLTLEGLTLGTVEYSDDLLKVLTASAKVLGLGTARDKGGKSKSGLDKVEEEDLLSFGKDHSNG